MILSILVILACSLLRPILDGFWDDFGSQNRPKIGPKRVPKGVGNHGRFCMPSGTSKNHVFGQHGPNLAPKMAPSWTQNGTKIGPKRVSEAKSVPEPILDRFLIDFGPIFGTIRGPNCVFSVLRHPRFPTNIDVLYIRYVFQFFNCSRAICAVWRWLTHSLTHFGSIFGTIFDRFWDDFWLNFDRCLCMFLFDFQHGRINKFIQTRAHTCPQITFRIYNESALPVPCIHRFLFLCFF